jgi:hypothetical protein
VSGPVAHLASVVTKRWNHKQGKGQKKQAQARLTEVKAEAQTGKCFSIDGTLLAVIQFVSYHAARGWQKPYSLRCLPIRTVPRGAS